MPDTALIPCRLYDHGNGVYTIDTDLDARGYESLAIPLPVVERVREQLETIASLTDSMTIKARCAAALSLLEHKP